MSARAADWLAYAAHRIGAPGLLGLTLLTAAALGWPMLTLPLHDRAASAHAEAARRAALPREAAPQPPQRVPQADLPPAGEAPRVLARLFAAAARAGLALDQGQYRGERDAAADIARMRIHLPLEGDYPALRGFIAEALAGNPGLALESLSLARKDMTSASVRAELRFALYLREARP